MMGATTIAAPEAADAACVLTEPEECGTERRESRVARLSGNRVGIPRVERHAIALFETVSIEDGKFFTDE